MIAVTVQGLGSDDPRHPITTVCHICDEHNEGGFHGMTVVVEMAGERIYVGRCSRFQTNEMVLVHCDSHQPAEGKPDRSEYIDKARTMGHWPNIEKILLPRTEIRSVTLLRDYEV